MSKHLSYDTLKINGQVLQGEDILTYCRESGDAYLNTIAGFVSQWLDDKADIELYSSGSTGSPKRFRASKESMLASAAMTVTFFDLRKNDNALLCLPVNYIAARMMIVRAFYAGLNLICLQPASDPLRELLTQPTHIHFAPLVPLQLQSVADVGFIDTILLGGAPLQAAMEEKLQHFSCRIYQSYGMAETLSHVAVRQINGAARSPAYRALPGIVLSTDERNCLVIEAPYLPEKIITNDIVEMKEAGIFEWKGRADNVLNSGGIKLHPEAIENKIFALLQNRFFIDAIPDKILGEKVCLFIESTPFDETRLNALQRKLAATLDKYEKPREIFFVKKFSETASGKIRRDETKKQFFAIP